MSSKRQFRTYALFGVDAKSYPTDATTEERMLAFLKTVPGSRFERIPDNTTIPQWHNEDEPGLIVNVLESKGAI